MDCNSRFVSLSYSLFYFIPFLDMFILLPIVLPLSKLGNQIRGNNFFSSSLCCFFLYLHQTSPATRKNEELLAERKLKAEREHLQEEKYPKRPIKKIPKKRSGDQTEDSDELIEIA